MVWGKCNKGGSDERRIEVIVKIQEKVEGGRGKGGQGSCERRIEVIVKMPKKKSRVCGGPVGGGGVVRVMVNKELRN